MPNTEAPPQLKSHRFTKETARAAAIRGNRFRWHQLQPLRNDPAANPPRLTPSDDYQLRRLLRVRAQLNRIDKLASRATDSKALKELADASARLSAQEFALAGRPMPGTLRPAADGARGGRRSRAEGSLLLDVSSSAVQVAPSATPTEARPIGWEYDPPSEVSPVTVASPPSTPDRLPGDVTP